MSDEISISIIDKFTSYLSTDKVAKSIGSVLVDTNTPIGFSRYTLKHKADFLYKEYAKDIHCKYPKLPKILKDAWVYENVFRSAISHRLNDLFSDHPDALDQMSRNVDRGILLLIDQHIHASLYVGFMYFEDNCQPFFGEYPVPSNASRIGLTRRFVSTIGNITEDDWLFHNPLWFSTLNNNHTLLRTLRGFVQIAYTNIFYTEEMFETVYDVSISELLDHMETFIELREATDVTRSDIVKFIEFVEHYALEAPVSSFYHMLCGAPFSHLKNSIEVESRPPSENTDGPLFCNNPIIMSLIHGCEEHSISRILDGPHHPEYLVDDILSAHYSDLVEDFIPLLYNDDWFEPGYKLPNKKPSNPHRLQELLYDHLYLAIVGLRVSHTQNPSLNYVMNYLVNTSHILLNLEDETETMGLSLITTLLPYYIRINYQNFSDRELETLMLIQWAWETSCYDRPNKISKMWKGHFRNPIVTKGLRKAFFSLFEVLNSDRPLDFQKTFHMERVDFFLYLENLCDFLTSNPMTQEVEELLSNAPHPKTSLFLSQEDFITWVGTQEDLNDQT